MGFRKLMAFTTVAGLSVSSASLASGSISVTAAVAAAARPSTNDGSLAVMGAMGSWTLGWLSLLGEVGSTRSGVGLAGGGKALKAVSEWLPSDARILVSLEVRRSNGTGLAG